MELSKSPVPQTKPKGWWRQPHEPWNGKITLSRQLVGALTRSMAKDKRNHAKYAARTEAKLALKSRRRQKPKKVEAHFPGEARVRVRGTSERSTKKWKRYIRTPLWRH